jgi:general secretion pathway protein I
MPACRSFAPAQAWRARGGFTLVEVLVAFTIASFLLVAMLRAVTLGLDGSRRAESYTRAAVLAESALDTMGNAAPLRDGDETELRDGPFLIHATVRRYAEFPGGQSLGLFRLSATVSWRDGRRDEAVSLQTLRLGRVLQ